MEKLCFCGSELPRFELRDARGIFCAYVCDDCEDDKKSRYRPEIFYDGCYDVDEPIDDDY